MFWWKRKKTRQSFLSNSRIPGIWSDFIPVILPGKKPIQFDSYYSRWFQICVRVIIQNSRSRIKWQSCGFTSCAHIRLLVIIWRQCSCFALRPCGIIWVVLITGINSDNIPGILLYYWQTHTPYLKGQTYKGHIFYKECLLSTGNKSKWLSLHVSADFQPLQTTNDDSKCHVQMNVSHSCEWCHNVTITSQSDMALTTPGSSCPDYCCHELVMINKFVPV